jgi:hypothetical protein
VIGEFLERVRRLLVKSPRIHLHQNPAESPRDLVGLIDRFLDGPMRYDLEWDDFISWKNENSHVEEIRNRICQFEPLLVSKTKGDRALYRRKLIEERNRLAHLLGLGVRDEQG